MSARTRRLARWSVVVAFLIGAAGCASTGPSVSPTPQPPSLVEVKREVSTYVDSGRYEAEVSAVMKKPEISLKVALGLGRGRDRVLTCDLTKEYVAINGDYRS